jgi:predicted DNA-binding transcriptional regulator AlpA
MPGTLKTEQGKSRIIGLKEVMRRVPWSKSKIYRDMKTGKFPPQAEKLEGSTSAGWHEDAIDDLVESLRPKVAPKESGSPAKEALLGEAGQADHPDRPLPLNLGPRTAPRRRQANTAEDETLIRTGMKLQGQDVYCHVPSRRLLVAVGSISDEYLAAVRKLSA